MSWPDSPAWLLELQARFGAMLRAPLDRATGALRADTASYDPALVAAVSPSPSLSSAERLAVYHRQYWFRLLTVLQGLYPLTARLLGYWRFNDFAATHLLERPPGGNDIDTLGEGFEQTLARLLAPDSGVALDPEPPLQRTVLLEAAHVDAAFHRVARAPLGPAFRPSAADAERLSSSRFVVSPSIALLEERWPLCELRLGFLDREPAEALALPEPLPQPRHWLLARHDSQLGLVALEPLEARLFALLQAHSLVQALGLLESEASAEQLRDLPLRAQAWLARSVRLGVWAGITDAAC